MQSVYEFILSIVDERDLLLVHGFATLYMTGLIWFVQLVHYPLFAQVGRHAHLSYHSAHVYWTTWAVGPPMLLELGITLLLCFSDTFARSTTVCGLIILIIIWLSTAMVQVPCHNQLALSFDSRIHRKLVLSNWVRTLGWTMRALIALFLLR